MLRLFDKDRKEITRPTVRNKERDRNKEICHGCMWCRVHDDQCWHPKQVCAIRTHPYWFDACPGDLWPKADGIREMILNYHRSQPVIKRLPAPSQPFALENRVLGLGDCVIMTDLLRYGRTVDVRTTSKHWPILMRYAPNQNTLNPTNPVVNLWDLYSRHDLGNGHLIQRLQRAFGLPVTLKPMGYIQPKLNTVKRDNRVILHFEPGIHANSQRQTIHPRARLLYPENKRIIEQFIQLHPEYEFIQVGSRRSILIDGAKQFIDRPLDESIDMISSASWFLGIISGPMHVATALGLRCVVVINFPPADRIYLPTLRATGQVEEEWFYPQNVHLHQDNAGPLVPRFSMDTLEQAFSGKVYPFWKDDYLDLINEQL